MRKLSNRSSRFHQVASLIEFEMLERRLMLSVSPALQNNPVPPPPMPRQPTPLQGVVGTPLSLDPQLLNDVYGFNAISYNVGGVLRAANGTDQTIAIVDPFGSPTIIQDLETFDAHWGISNNDGEGNFALTVQALAPTVNTSAATVADEQSWAGETSLDVEWAHAVAPGAHILLVEAPSENILDLMDADVFAAAQTGVVAVSMSWQFDNALLVEPFLYDGFMVTPLDHQDNDAALGFGAGVVFLAASGDTDVPTVATAFSLSWPATSANVLSIGGETTGVGVNGSFQGVKAWSNFLGASGGGPDPNYTSHFNVPIVALDADPLSGVWVYDSTPDNGQVGWGVVGGTSFSCPAWAGVIAIVDQGLQLRGIASLDNSQALGLSSYDERTNQVADPYGILGLEETGSGPPNNLPFSEPDGHITYNDLDTLTIPAPTSFPLWPVPVPGGPTLTAVPSNGNTGFGAPDGGAFNFVEDMVGGETNADDALNITVPDGFLPQLAFSVGPSTEVAGQLIPVSVTAFLDGVEDTAFTGSVTLGLLGPPGSALSGTTTVNAVGGVATFTNLTVNTDGNYQLIATSNAANGSDSGGFAITSGPIAQLNFIDQPSSLWQYGTLSTPLILGIEDQFGNVVTSVNSIVSLAIASGPFGGTIMGNTTTTAANGQAVFTNLTFAIPGTYTLIATDGLLSVTSNSFVVVPIPVPLHFTFNGAALSRPAILFEQLRNAPLFTSKSGPSAAAVAQIFAANNDPQKLANDSATPAAVVRVAPDTFSAAATPIGGGSGDTVSSQLLDDSKSGINQLLQ